MNIIRLIAALLLSFSFNLSVLAQTFSIGSGAQKAPKVNEQVGMPAGKIYVNLSTIPKARPSFKVERVMNSFTGPYSSGNQEVNVPKYFASSITTGAFRVSCKFSHAAFDDPIVWPGQAGRTHLHQFFGNTLTRSSTVLDNMASSGDSTCAGGIFNRTGYWTPTLVYHCPAGSTDGCNTARDGEVKVVDAGANFYYKCSMGFDCRTGGNGGTPLQWWPVGFRMIAGNPNATTDQDGRILWRCLDSGGLELWRGGHIPTDAELAAAGGAGACTGLEASVTFPICWDGVNITSPGLAQGHVDTARPYHENWNTGCQGNTAFPVLTPEISLNLTFGVNASDIKYLRLSSDPPKSSGVSAGVTMHSDWVNGWSTRVVPEFGNMTVTDAILKECYSLQLVEARGRDCHNHLLGNPSGDGINWLTLF